jgi:NADPH2:quinone reductase
MKAVQVRRFGGPEVLVPGEVPDPVAAAGEVVVAVSVAPVLFLDTQIRWGAATEWFPVRPPYVPGVGVAGWVRSVGDGVDPGWLGRRVVADADGGYAELAAVGAAGLVVVPDGVSLSVAAALLHDGRTALGLADAAGFRAGEWVLVTSAAGGLGSLLVRLAVAAGARVVGAARGARKHELVSASGAEVVVDYSDADWIDRVRAATGGVSVVLDGVGGDVGSAAFDVTVDGGRFFGYGTPGGGFATVDPTRRSVSVHGIESAQFAPDVAQRLTERALAEAAAGRIEPVVGQTFPLDRAADAHAAIESRDVVGKTLLLTQEV